MAKVGHVVTTVGGEAGEELMGDLTADDQHHLQQREGDRKGAGSQCEVEANDGQKAAERLIAEDPLQQRDRHQVMQKAEAQLKRGGEIEDFLKVEDEESEREEAAEADVEQKTEKVALVPMPDATIGEVAVMIAAEDASLAGRAVMGASRLQQAAHDAFRSAALRQAVLLALGREVPERRAANGDVIGQDFAGKEGDERHAQPVIKRVGGEEVR